jgi:hypothetical protein
LGEDGCHDERERFVKPFAFYQKRGDRRGEVEGVKCEVSPIE